MYVSDSVANVVLSMSTLLIALQPLLAAHEIRHQFIRPRTPEASQMFRINRELTAIILLIIVNNIFLIEMMR